MIDPKTITNFNQKSQKLEEVLLFWVCAAGKNAITTARCLDSLLRDLHGEFNVKLYRPFDVIGMYIDKYGINALALKIKSHGLGCYNYRARTFYKLVLSGLNLKKCTVEDLEKITGIGPKTSRCFLMHSRKDVRHAGLDTHIKKYLRDCGHNVPSALTSKNYAKYEKIFLSLADRLNKSPAELDLEIWNKYRSIKSK